MGLHNGPVLKLPSLRVAFALLVLVAQAASLAHLAIADHTLAAGGHLIEVGPSSHPSPEGLSAANLTALLDKEERCVVFDAAQAPLESSCSPARKIASTPKLAEGFVRPAFLRCALIDAPKASPPSSV